MAQSPTTNRIVLERNQENEKRIDGTSAAPTFEQVEEEIEFMVTPKSTSYLSSDAAPTSEQMEGEKELMVTPKSTSYLSSDGKSSPEETKLPSRVQSTQSLLGLAGLEGHEDEISSAGMSAVTEEQEVMDIVVSPTTPASLSENLEIEDATCNTTPPGSVQGPGILSLSPPRLTTYSVGSVTSASVTESFVLQPRPVQSMQRQNHLSQESPRFSRSPLVQQPQLHPQLQPRSRPPRAPHHHSTTPGGNNSVGGGPIVLPQSSSLSGPGASGGGHTRTPTDATNYSFLSSLTDVSGGEYSAPRRRTLSWDNNANMKKGGHGTESKSLGGPSTGSILQPILLPEDLESTARPPMSISASNLRKALPVVPGPTAAIPIHTPSRNTGSTPLLAPSSLPSRENLHPLIEKLQSVSRGKSPSHAPLASQSKPESNLHPLVRKVHDKSPSKSFHTLSTSSSSPFTVHLDEKKDDDSSSHPLTRPKPLQDRKTSDYGSYSSSFCSSSTIRLQKKTIASPENMLGVFDRQTSPQRISENSATGDPKDSGCTRLNLTDILDATKECNVETDILDEIERNRLIDNGNKNDCNDISSFSNWPYFLLSYGILNLASRGFVLNASAQVRNIFVSEKVIQFCSILGAAAVMKRTLSKKFLDRQVIGQYRDELSRLRNIWVVLNEIAELSTTEEEDNSDEAKRHIMQFRSVSQCIDKILDWNSYALFGDLGTTTRENFIESAQFVYERIARREGEAELNFKNLCEVAKLPDASIDEPKMKLLSDLFCPLRQGKVSKFDFVKSTDSIFKNTTLLIANISNASEICSTIDHIINFIFYSIAAILAPSVIGVDINTLLLTLLGISVNLALAIYLTSAEDLKGIIRLVTQKSYDIGDRVYFLNPEDTDTKVDDGPPSGGWIVEKIDLCKTTLRQGITGERSTLSNGSALLVNSRVMNWKRSHNAIVRLSMEFSGKTGRDKINFFQRQISEWIEDRPSEWMRLNSFRMVGAGIQQQCVKYDVVLQHRESWYNYAAVQDSKSDILIFLHELRNGVEA